MSNNNNDQTSNSDINSHPPARPQEDTTTHDQIQKRQLDPGESGLDQDDGAGGGGGRKTLSGEGGGDDGSDSAEKEEEKKTVGGSKGRIEDVMTAGAGVGETDVDRKYREAMEDEYAKREGGA